MLRNMTADSAMEHIEQAREALAAEDFARAHAGFRKAAAHARQDDRRPELAYALRHSALSALECGEAQAALADATEAASIYADIEPERGLNHANTRRLIALAKEGIGRAEDAQRDWQAARAIYSATGITAGVEECDAHLKPA